MQTQINALDFESTNIFDGVDVHNLLNLPDTIQFSNGNQIVNRYAADGRKLGTEFFTQLAALALPLVEGQVKKQQYSFGFVDQSGIMYINNFEYKTQNGSASLTNLNKVFNAEGYVDEFANNTSYSGYCYYRTDHLGNVCEVWRAGKPGGALAATLQKTFYFPSGLPLSYSTSPGLQPNKYNNKPFIEMHGLDTYDYSARMMYPAIGDRFLSVDPLCEKYYWISPYAYCLNNPVNAIDPDGREVYKLGFSYSMSSGVIGASVNLLGLIGLGVTYSPGAAKQELGFYVSYDTDNKSAGIGVTHTKTIIDSGNSVTVGPYKHSESNEKAEVRDANTTTGVSKTVDKSVTKSESGGLGPIETTEENGVATSGVSVSGEINAGMVGVGAKIGITIEPSPKTTTTNNKPASTSSSSPAPGTSPLRPEEPSWKLF